MNFLEQKLTIPVEEVDVVVAGGGPAGVGAAIAAARLGLKTLLLERYGFLGGMWTAGYVNPIHDVNNKQNGILCELVNTLRARGGWGGFYDLCFDFELCKLILDEMVLKSGARVLLHTWVADAWMEEGRVQGVIIENKDGRSAIKAQTVIDCTGDGDVAFRAGAPYWMGRPQDGLCQPMSTLFVIGGVDYFQPHSRSINELVQKALWEHPEPFDTTYTRPYIIALPNAGRAVVEWIHVRKKLGTNARELTEAEFEGRGHVFRIVDFLRRRVPGFENCELLSIAPQIGVRETRRIKGLYTLTKEDCLTGAQFADGICDVAFGIDLHQPDQIDQDNFHTKQFQVPYRCLVPVQTPGLLTAGRCISGTFEAHGSYRVTSDCLVMGEAAGIAAYLAKQESTELAEVDIAQLRALLGR